MRINTFLLVVIAMVMYGCGSKHTDAVPESPVPEKPILLFPSENSACTSSTVLSSTQSSVLLTWDEVKYADNYDVVVKNLISGEIVTQNTTQPQFMATLLRSTPYSWHVIAKSAKTAEVTTSDTWKFYNPGPGAIYYAPFPVDAVAPALDENVTAVAGKVNLKWQSADPDNDITGYDVYWGTDPANLLLVKANETNEFLNDNTVMTHLNYYWKIVTKDAKGNSSESGIFHFKVN